MVLPHFLLRTLLPGCLLLCAAASNAQINIGDKLERKAKERLERKVDRTIDKGFDKAEEGVDKGSKEVGKEATKGGKDKKGTEADKEPTGTGNTSTAPGANAPLKAYSKFDFVPGEQVIAVEDLRQDAVGDFPAKWNTNSSGEVVTIEGRDGRWLKIGGKGYYYPEFLSTLPENATIEFDVATSDTYSYYCTFINALFVDARHSPNLLRPAEIDQVAVRVHPQAAGGNTGSTSVRVCGADGKEIMANERGQSQLMHRGTAPVAHVAIWRQKNRLRVYLNDEKVWDLPRAFQNDADYRLVFEGGSCDASTAYLGELRVAAGAPDTRNKLITEGRLVTRGILFDSGSDRIKGGSYGTLKDIATVLTDNPEVKVAIIGHTDSDGEEAANLDLSKRRAAAVKDALTKEFGIAAARMETDGKGEGQPAGTNDTPQGKANNRRVEFVKR